MRLIINLLLILLVGLLAYILVDSIREPIAFKAEKEKRETAVVDKLMKVRQAQEMYRSITGYFAPTFDTLQQVLTDGRFSIVKVLGDPDDPDNVDAITYDTTYKPAIDSVRILGMDLASLRYVPFTNPQKQFEIAADTMTYQKTLVSVVEVGTKRANYMGEFASPRFAKYDNAYNPNGTIKFGDMNAPKLSGNWEN